jgi:hypothetical protein
LADERVAWAKNERRVPVARELGRIGPHRDLFCKLGRESADRRETNRADARLIEREQNKETAQMCDYSLSSVRSRPAQVGDKLATRNFGTGTRGFCATEDADMAVCVLPGTELSFADDVRCVSTGLLPWWRRAIKHKTAIFRQTNTARLDTHHDALEFPDGRIVLLTMLCEAQQAAVLQLPVRSKNADQAARQQRAAYTG